MASVRVFSGATIGLDAFPVEVEVDSTPGLHSLNIVGLPDKTVEESKDRIASAIRNSGFIAPSQKNRRVIVNLAPADIKKEGPAYDLPIALGYLLTTKQIQFKTDEKLFMGELSLDGSIRRVTSVLPIAIMAEQKGFKEIVIPYDNLGEASVLKGISLIGVKTLTELVSHLQGKTNIKPAKPLDYSELLQEIGPVGDEFDMSQIKGQENAKRALTIAASGGHNILFYGSPGSGKTLLAQALPGILPDMNRHEALEVTKIYSISGMLKSGPIIFKRPFRNPHHTTSAVAVIGGGAWPKPGEISLAHRGILFLDELPEFPRNVIEALRQPMESGEVVVSRASGSVRFPCRFMLVGAMNPCPCGNFGDEIKPCVCTTQTVYRYQKKISGPVLDRIDIQVNVPRETYERLSGGTTGLTNKEIKATVTEARKRQLERFSETTIQTNSEMGTKEIAKYCALGQKAEQLIKTAVTNQNLSGRSYHKILKIARTIADIAGKENIEADHIGEAISYRIKQENSGLV